MDTSSGTEMKRDTVSGIMFLIVLTLVAPVLITFAHLPLDDSPELNAPPDVVSQVYIPHDWISIVGNEGFFHKQLLKDGLVQARKTIQLSLKGTVLASHDIYSEQFTPMSILCSEIISLMVLIRAGAGFI